MSAAAVAAAASAVAVELLLGGRTTYNVRSRSLLLSSAPGQCGVGGRGGGTADANDSDDYHDNEHSNGPGIPRRTARHGLVRACAQSCSTLELPLNIKMDITSRVMGGGVSAMEVEKAPSSSAAATASSTDLAKRQESDRELPPMRVVSGRTADGHDLDCYPCELSRSGHTLAGGGGGGGPAPSIA